MTEIYRHEHVAASQEFYGKLLINFPDWSVAQHLSLMANRLHEGYRQKNPVAGREINNYHPGWLGKPFKEVFQANLTLDDIQQAIASQYGFQNWETVAQLTTNYFIPFEEALSALLNGNISALKTLLAAHPELIRMTSPYGHQAQLIHYVGNNGVELWRQQVPLNLAAVIQILLDAGADKSATMPVYGGHFTALQLFATSAHPKKTGITQEVLDILT